MLHYHNTPETQGEDKNAIYQPTESSDAVDFYVFRVARAQIIPGFDFLSLTIIFGKLFSKTKR